MNLPSLLRTTQVALNLHRNLNCWSFGITKKHRKYFLREYPTILVFPNGSSINITYYEPRRIIRLPVNIDTLSDMERKAIIEKRKVLKKIKIVEEFQDEFDANQFFESPKDDK